METQQQRIYTPLEVIDLFSQTEAAKDPTIPLRADIVKLIGQYRTWETKKVYGGDLVQLQSYCDFLPDSITTLLTRTGEERTLGEVTKNFDQLKSQLPTDFVNYIHNLGTSIKAPEDSKSIISPLILLKDPEVFNGQIVDGVHRSLAYVSEFQQSNGSFDPGLSALVGSDPINKVLLRQLKQTMVREWRRVKPPMIK